LKYARVAKVRACEVLVQELAQADEAASVVGEVDQDIGYARGLHRQNSGVDVNLELNVVVLARSEGPDVKLRQV
jgi:hypothetical protein